MLMHEWFIAIPGTILLPRGGSRNSSRGRHWGATGKRGQIVYTKTPCSAC
eukprot:COSAG02_NODE_10285_length_1977_cov_130.638978_1_plen_50_part_00